MIPPHSSGSAVPNMDRLLNPRLRRRSHLWKRSDLRQFREAFRVQCGIYVWSYAWSIAIWEGGTELGYCQLSYCLKRTVLRCLESNTTSLMWLLHVITVLLIKAHRWTRWTSLQLEVLATACAAVFVMLDAGAPEATLGQHTSPQALESLGPSIRWGAEGPAQSSKL